MAVISIATKVTLGPVSKDGHGSGTEEFMTNTLTTTGSTTRSTKDLMRVAVSGWLGTAMEYMDFQLYSLASALIFGKIFFPNLNPAVGLMAAFLGYAVGFMARPLGAWFFGRMGDRLGRKKVLVLTIGLMGVSTMLIGFLPTYAQIGIWAPIMLFSLRIAQGFGAGAELSGASVMLAEYAPAPRRGLVASFVCLGTTSGTLLATGIWVLLTRMPDNALYTWGWRIPFILSIAISIYSLWIRRNLKESPVFETTRDAALEVKNGTAKLPRARFGKSFLIAVCLRIGESGNSAMIQTFLVGYVVSAMSMDKGVGTLALLIGSFIGIATTPLAGWLSDKIGRRAMYRGLSAFQFAFAIPAMLMLTSGNQLLVSLALIIGLSVSVVGMFSVQSAYLNELFGARNRYTQLALAKEIGGVLSGGLAPLIAAALLVAFAHAWWPFAAMMMFYAGIALVATFFAPETKGRDLTLMADAV